MLIDKPIYLCSVQFSHSVVSNSLWPHESQLARLPAHHQPQSLPKLMCIESMTPSNHLIPCHPLLLLPSIPPSIRVFSNESVLHIRWPKYWSFSFSISPSNEYSGLTSSGMDWFDLLAVQGTLRSLLHGGLQSIGSQRVGHNWATNPLCSQQRHPIQEEDSGHPLVGTP